MCAFCPTPKSHCHGPTARDVEQVRFVPSFARAPRTLRNSPPRLLSTTSTSSVLVYFERPVRPLLRAAGGRRKERVAVDPLAPLDSLTDHIAAKLNDGADAALLRARHGRRHLASNDELRAALRSVTPPTTVVVRVGAAPGAATVSVGGSSTE